jgi:hemoglobin
MSEIASVPVLQPGECAAHASCAASASKVGRLVGATHELDFPELKFPSASVLEIAGEASLRKLVRRHHDLLRNSKIGGMFSADEREYEAAVNKIADYVVESCGGPAYFTLRHGESCMRTRHFPFTIDETGRDIWLGCLWQALQESGFPGGICLEYWIWMESFSIRMINRRTMRAQPKRYTYERGVIE